MKILGYILLTIGVLQLVSIIVRAFQGNSGEAMEMLSVCTCFLLAGGALTYVAKKKERKAKEAGQPIPKTNWAKVIFVTLLVMFWIGTIGKIIRDMTKG